MTGTLVACAPDMTPGKKAWPLVQPLLTVGERHGVERHAMQRCLTLPVDSNALASLPIESVFALWASVASATRDPLLPLRAAKLLRLDSLDVMGFAVMTAPTGHEALARAIRYARLITSSGQWHSTQGDGTVAVSWVRSGERWLGHRLANESGVAQFVSCMRQLFGEAFSPQRVTFRHAAPATVAGHREFFRCPVLFSEAADGFTFSRTALDRAPPMAHPALAAFLQSQAEARLAQADRGSTASALRQALEHELRREEPDLSAARLARALGTSQRTLRRRLHEEGTSLRSLLADARRDTARLLLEHGGAPLTEIARRVGFSDSSAFAHAARRWFGHAPRDLRRKPQS